MVARINVKSDMAEVLGALARDYPDAARRASEVAIVRTSRAVRTAQKAEIIRVFDRPTPWTQGAIHSRFNKRELSATVWLNEEPGKGTPATTYLLPQIEGGERGQKRFERALQRVGLLPAGWLAVPGQGARLDAYGNMSRGQIVQIMAWFSAFGEQGYSANMTAKGRARLSKSTKRRQGFSYFAVYPGRTRTRHLHPGIYQRFDFAVGSAIKPVLIFVRAAHYQKRYDFHGVAQREVDRTFKPELDAAVQIELDRIAQKASRP